MISILSSLGSPTVLPEFISEHALRFCTSDNLQKALQECSKANIECFSLLDGVSLLKKTEAESLYLYYENGQALEWDQSKYFLLSEAGISVGEVEEVVPLLRRMPLFYPDTFPFLTLLRQPGLMPWVCFPSLSAFSYLTTRGYTSEGTFRALGESSKVFTLPPLSSLHKAPSFALLSPAFFPVDFSLLFQPMPDHQAIFTIEESVLSPEHYQTLLPFLMEKTMTGFVWAEERWTLFFHDAYPGLLNKKVAAVQKQISLPLHSSVRTPAPLSSPCLLQSTLPLEAIPALFPFPFPAPLFVFPLTSFQKASVVVAFEWEVGEPLLAYFRTFSPYSMKLFLTYANHHC